MYGILYMEVPYHYKIVSKFDDLYYKTDKEKAEADAKLSEPLIREKDKKSLQKDMNYVDIFRKILELQRQYEEAVTNSAGDIEFAELDNLEKEILNLQSIYYPFEPMTLDRNNKTFANSLNTLCKKPLISGNKDLCVIVGQFIRRMMLNFYKISNNYTQYKVIDNDYQKLSKEEQKIYDQNLARNANKLFVAKDLTAVESFVAKQEEKEIMKEEKEIKDLAELQNENMYLIEDIGNLYDNALDLKPLNEAEKQNLKLKFEVATVGEIAKIKEDAHANVDNLAEIVLDSDREDAEKEILYTILNEIIDISNKNVEVCDDRIVSLKKEIESSKRQLNTIRGEISRRKKNIENKYNVLEAQKELNSALLKEFNKLMEIAMDNGKIEYYEEVKLKYATFNNFILKNYPSLAHGFRTFILKDNVVNSLRERTKDYFNQPEYDPIRGEKVFEDRLNEILTGQGKGRRKNIRGGKLTMTKYNKLPRNWRYGAQIPVNKDGIGMNFANEDYSTTGVGQLFESKTYKGQSPYLKNSILIDDEPEDFDKLKFVAEPGKGGMRSNSAHSPSMSGKKGGKRSNAALSPTTGGAVYNDYTNEAKKILKDLGGEPIQSITIFRYPLQSGIQKALEVVTKGKSKENYDKLFHLGMIVRINDTDVLVEKNENITINKNIPHNADMETISVNVPQGLTLEDMLEDAREDMGDDAFWDYEAFSTNCQNFMLNLLKSSGLLTKAEEEFIYQDLTQLIKDTPAFVRKLAKSATTAKAIVNKVMGVGKRSSSDKGAKKKGGNVIYSVGVDYKAGKKSSKKKVKFNSKSKPKEKKKAGRKPKPKGSKMIL